MKRIFASTVVAVALSSVLIPAAQAKVCFICAGSKPHKYVCAGSDTFTARKNARRLGCKVSGTTSSCKCGAEVSDRSAGMGGILRTLGLLP